MGGGSSAPATGDVLADAWRELHKANVFLANAHHTSRTVPHNGDLAGAIQNARVAEELILRHAKLSSADKLLIYGPKDEIYKPEKMSPIEHAGPSLS